MALGKEEHRPHMVRAVAARRPPARNEDLAIVNIHPLPGNPMHFGAVRAVIREFLEDVRGLVVVDIQPCHLGQAFIRFASVHDRDNLILQGPIPFDNVMLTFTKHNEGRNWRRVQFNTECWLMLMGFPVDYWDEHFIQDAIGTFGKLTVWEEDKRHLTRVVIKARVLDLQSIPHFILFSETQGFQGQSWSVQCEILQHQFLGGGPQDEDPVPVAPIANAPFDFFGLGQPGAGPIHEAQNGGQILPWEPWPADQDHNNGQLQNQLGPLIDQLINDHMQVDYIANPLIDLNNDPQEVILNPVQHENDFIEINNPLQIAEEVQLPQPEPDVLPENLAEVQLVQLADEIQNEQAFALHNPEDLNIAVHDIWDEEIQLDQLVDFDEPNDQLAEQAMIIQEMQDIQHEVDDIRHHEMEVADADNNEVLAPEQPLAQDNLVLNAGFVNLPPPAADPGFEAWEQARSAMATRLWAKYFCSDGAVAHNSATIKITEITEEMTDHITPPAKRGRPRKEQVVVDTELRRSPRIKEMDPEELNDEKLMTKKMKPGPIGGDKGKDPEDKEEKEQDEHNDHDKQN